MKKRLFVIVGLLTAISSFAQKFTYTHEGQTLNYQIMDKGEMTCEVCPPNDISGDLVIPEYANYGSNPYKVTSVGDRSFSSNHNLKKVLLPNSVTSIGVGAFNYCTSLASINFTDSLRSIGDAAFCKCESLDSISFGKNIKKISNECFGECSSLKTIVWGDSIQEIGQKAFRYCTSLETFEIPNSVLNIGYSILQGCHALRSLKIGDKLQHIIDGSIEDCENLESIEFGKSVWYIGDRAFRCCKGLTTLYLPSTISHLGAEAFAYCWSLSSLIIPPSVTKVSGNTFERCGFKKVAHPDNLTFPYGWLDASIKISYPQEGSEIIDSCIIVNNVDNTLYYVDLPYEGNFIVPDNIVRIGEHAFSYCNNIDYIEMPNSVTTIERYAMNECEGLQKLVLSPSLISIGEYLVGTRQSLQEIEYMSENPCSGPANAFFGAYDTATLYIPAGTREKYETTQPWLNFKNIVEKGSSGIDNIYSDSTKEDNSPVETYNLRGERVNNPTQGVIIERRGSTVTKRLF